jgi:hypothetical protein
MIRRPMDLDSHGQPCRHGFNESRRIERDVSEMLGVAKGILADRRGIGCSHSLAQ